MQTDSNSFASSKLRKHDLRVLKEVKDQQPDAYGPDVVKAVIQDLGGPKVLRAVIAAKALLKLEKDGLVQTTPETEIHRIIRLEHEGTNVWRNQQRVFYILTPRGEELVH